MKTTIQPPAYDVIQRTTHVVSVVELDNLIALFTSNEVPGGLLIYNTEQVPALPAEIAQMGWNTVSLSALRPADYADYDGPVIGVSAIDILLDGVPTHGVHYFPLEDLEPFRHPEHKHTFAGTAYHLLEALTDRWLQLSSDKQTQQRSTFCKRAIQLCLPALLEAFPDPDLVALRFDLSGEGFPQVAKDVAHPVFDRPDHSEDIASLASLKEGEWVVGLSELPLLVRSMKQHTPRLLSLRPSMRKFVDKRVMADTCRRLARRCWQEWNHSAQDELQQAAYALAVEAWFKSQDATDVVAVLPLGGFQNLVNEGRALAVSRGPVPAISNADRCSLEDVLRSEVPTPNDCVFAVPILAPVLSRAGASRVFDLGPVLWQSRGYGDLARTVWLLSRDLLQPPQPIWRQVDASIDDITELARRAALIYGLGNPWTWRQGRYSLLLSECYIHLDNCLQQQEQDSRGKPQAFYYTALRAWYGCAMAEDVTGNLTRIAEYSRLFLIACQDQGVVNEQIRKIETAKRLIELSQHFLQPDTLELPLPHGKTVSVTDVLCDITNSEQRLPLPSRAFDFWLQEYLHSRNKWRDIKANAHTKRPDPDDLNLLQNEISQLERRVFAPQHEQAILLAAATEEGKEIRRLQQAVGQGAVIKIISRTREINLGDKQKVIFEIQNNGSQAASELLLRLERYSGFDLASGMPNFEPINLGPGEQRRVEFYVRATERSLALIFGYRFRDFSGRWQADETPVHMQAQRETRGLRTKINPFEVGRPVSGAIFFGRHNEISRILTRLAKGDTHPLVLRGPRRIGKSSLLRQIARVLDQPTEAKDVSLSSDLTVALRTLHPILVNLQNMDRNLPHPFGAFVSSILEEICRKLALEPESIVQTYERMSGQYGVPRSFQSQMGEILRRRPGERLVILLDELDGVFRSDASETGIQLRNMIETETRVSWVAASTMLVRSSIGQYSSPWFNLLEPIELRAMDWSSAFKMLRQLGGRAGFDWSDEATTAVLDLAGRRPYLIQLLGANVTDDLNDQGRDRVTGGDVNACANRLLDEISLTGSYLGFVWNEAQWLGKLMLWNLVDAPAPFSLPDLSRQIRQQADAEGISINDNQFNRAFAERLAWLTDIADTLEIYSAASHSAISRKGYRFSIPLVRRWLKEIIEQEPDFIERATTGLVEELKD